MGPQYRYRPGEMVPGTDLKIIRPIGSGGMGAVYEVEETSVEAPFVMKVVHPHLLLASGSRVAERMRQEAKTQARLNHRNIVRVYRAGVTLETPPLPFYVMDRLSGYAVRQVLRWHRNKRLLLPLSWAFWIGASLLQALDHAHKNGVIHRDVKPDNIFIHHVEGQRPVVKLLDFGIMAAVSEFSEQKRLTGTGFAGTYTHAAPEQLQGARPAPPLDIYAAGMVLYEMLAGCHPFEDRDSPQAIVYAHIHEPPPPITQRPGLHPKLEALVQRMLAKDPIERPQSAADALNVLATIKMEWLQQSSDESALDAVDFHFEADIAERWPTNVDGGDDFSLDDRSDSGGARDGSPRSELSAAAELANGRSLDFSAENLPDRGSVPTRAGWGTTIDGKGSLVRASHVLIAAVGFAGMVVGAGWVWTRTPSTTQHPSPSATSGPTTAAGRDPETERVTPAPVATSGPEVKEQSATDVPSPSATAATSTVASAMRGNPKRPPGPGKAGPTRPGHGDGRHADDDIMKP